MTKLEKLLLKILRGKSDANIGFDELRKIIIYWSEEDKIFIAEAPELPGCAAHGHSPDKALMNCNEAINLWIDTAKEFGRTIPTPKGRRLQYA